jgi:extracellular factor (EF) 3-hydroxypalmitic acid methyl ester biosynthesis protein
MARQHRGKVVQHASFLGRALTTPRDHRTRILNVGCGPSFDVRLALWQIAESLDAEVLLADLDPQALAFSRRQLGADAPVRIEYRESDVVALVRQLASARPAPPRFDAILFGGLFDYVPDDAVSFILRRATQLLAPGGSVLFSQVSTTNPDRTAMEWFCDWRLLERDEDGVRRLVTAAGIDEGRALLWRDGSGVSILCEITA